MSEIMTLECCSCFNLHENLQLCRCIIPEEKIKFHLSIYIYLIDETQLTHLLYETNQKA